tara:strand:+ start:3858 stop:4037 length:180 start_codon:yes stop_codon:yes gene_type:complete
MIHGAKYISDRALIRLRILIRYSGLAKNPKPSLNHLGRDFNLLSVCAGLSRITLHFCRQ